MKDERTDKIREPAATEPAFTPLGTPPEPPIRSRAGDIIHTSPELAVGEGDVRTAERGIQEPLKGSSLWKDAWRRLLKNKLAVFGMVVVIFIALASIIGPFIIQKTTGYSYNYQPPETSLKKPFPPFTAPDGTFSGTHPMGTDNLGRDILARVLTGGQISLMVGLISTLVSLLIGVTYGATAGYLGGRIDNVMMRLVDILYALLQHDNDHHVRQRVEDVNVMMRLVDILYALPYMMIVIVLLAFFGGTSPRGQLFLLFIALGAVSWLTMARIVRGQVMSLKNQEFVLAARATGV